MNENQEQEKENIKINELGEGDREINQDPHNSFAEKEIDYSIPRSNYYLPTKMQRERMKICLFCNRIVDNSRKICSGCIDERRPKLSTAKYILFSILAFFPGVVYKNLVENEQKEWDLKYL
jgi:hypothetical protein